MQKYLYDFVSKCKTKASVNPICKPNAEYLVLVFQFTYVCLF